MITICYCCLIVISVYSLIEGYQNVALRIRFHKDEALQKLILVYIYRTVYESVQQVINFMFVSAHVVSFLIYRPSL